MAEQNQQERQTAYKALATHLVNGTYEKQEGFNPNFVVTPSGRKISRVRITGVVTNTYEKDDGSYAAITVDDGTATIRGKAFQELDPVTGVEEGDIVELVGKVRKYEGEIYIQAEHVFPRTLHHELAHVLDVHEGEQEWRDIVDQVREQKDEDMEDIANTLGLAEDVVAHLLDYINSVGFNAAADTAAQPGQDTSASPTSGGDGATQQPGQEEDGEESPHTDTVIALIKEHDTGDGADYSTLLDAADLEEETFEDVVNELLSDGTCYEPRPGKIKIL